jgi:hypothetical protein
VFGVCQNQGSSECAELDSWTRWPTPSLCARISRLALDLMSERISSSSPERMMSSRRCNMLCGERTLLCRALIWLCVACQDSRHRYTPPSLDSRSVSTVEKEFSRTSDPIASMSGGIESTGDIETASARSFQSAPSPRPRSLLARLDTATTASNSTFPSGERFSGVPIRRGTSETLQVPSLPSPIYRAPTRESLAPVSPPPIGYGYNMVIWL